MLLSVSFLFSLLTESSSSFLPFSSDTTTILPSSFRETAGICTARHGQFYNKSGAADIVKDFELNLHSNICKNTTFLVSIIAKFYVIIKT